MIISLEHKFRGKFKFKKPEVSDFVEVMSVLCKRGRELSYK